MSRSWDIILIGVVLYAVLACGLLQGMAVFPYGQNFYDEYYLAILDGHLDLPPRVIQVEGHYTPDAVAYLYHGVAPLIPRFLFGWIWPFENWSLAPLSIWIWACAGTLSYHAAFMNAGRRAFAQLGDQGVQLSRYLSIAVWFGGPGMLLAASTTFYHEPIALSYAATGVFVLIWSQYSFNNWPLWKLALPAAMVAAIALHARPNVAIGLYLAAVLLLACLTVTSLKKHWLRIALSLLILGGSGLGFLALNSARFGSVSETHGSFDKSATQYGFVYWGAEDENSDRANAFKRHGKFNAKRIPHNAVIYMFDLPALGTALENARDRFHAYSNQVLAENLGYIRIEAPFAGLIFLWPLWLLLACFSLASGRQAWVNLSIPIAGAAATLFLTLAYGTVTLRYRIDLWPFFSLLALLGISAALRKYAANPERPALKWTVIACFLTGVVITAICVSQLRFFQTGPQLKPSWSLEECKFLMQKKSLPQSDLERICRPPRIDVRNDG